MATLTIKELDDWIYARLRERAKRHRRSIVAEATVILEHAVSGAPADDAELLQRAGRLRETSSASISSHEAFRRMVAKGRP